MKSRIRKNEIGSFLTLAATLVLFVVALFEKGLTHEMLLEAGVFLVSVKLVLAANRSKLDIERLEEKIDRLLERSSG